MNTQTYSYKQAAGCDIWADVYLPAGAGPYPVLLWLHGGALIFGSRSGLSPDQAALYTGAGYAVVAADYRLAPETKLPAIIEDLRDAGRWVRSEGPRLFGADPARLAVVGHSAGGYLTLMSGFALEPRPRALVSFYGYGDIVGPWYSRPDPFYCREPQVTEEAARASVGSAPISESRDEERFRFYLYCRQQGLWPQEVAGRDPAAEPGFFDRFCPIRQVTPAYPPTLLLHGSLDTDVPHEQSVMMAEALAGQGVAHELAIISGAEHGFDHHEAHGESDIVRRAFERVLGFLARHVT